MDGVSGVASIVSIAGLAVQVGSKVKQLKQFVSSIKSAPRELQRVEETLNILSAVLERIENESPGATEQDDQPVLQALLACSNRVQELLDSFKDLSQALDSDRKVARVRASIKMVSKEQAVARLEGQLESAKSTLILALQSSARQHWVLCRQLGLATIHSSPSQPTPHLPVLIEESHSHPIVHLSAAEITILNQILEPVLRSQGSSIPRKHSSSYLAETTNNPLSRQEHHFDRSSHKSADPSRWFVAVNGQNHSRYELLAGTVHYAHGHFEISSVQAVYEDTFLRLESSDEAYRISLAPSRLMITLGFTQAMDLLALYSLRTGWKVLLSTPRIRPDDHKIFRHCRLGDIGSVRDLLAKGEASVQDVDSNGVTLLHIAAGNHDPDLCRFLLDEGADKHARDWGRMGQSPFSRACFPSLCPEHTKAFVEESGAGSRQIDTFRVFLSAGYDAVEGERNEGIFQLASRSSDLAFEFMQCSSLSEYPSMWLLKHIIQDEPKSCSPRHNDVWINRLLWASEIPGKNPLADMLPYCRDVVVRQAFLRWLEDLGSDHYRRGVSFDGYVQDFKIFRERLGTSPFTESRGYPWQDPPKILSPMRAAMRHSRSFKIFRGLVKHVGEDLETYAIDEASMLNDRWSSSAMLRLLKDDYDGGNETYWAISLSCRPCQRAGLWRGGHFFGGMNMPGEWIWDHRKARIKGGVDPDSPLCEHEKAMRAKYYKYYRVFEETGRCWSCQDRMEQEAKADIETPLGLLDLSFV